nr:hypothetical protein [Tanacetum cinerariifolium]
MHYWLIYSLQSKKVRWSNKVGSVRFRSVRQFGSVFGLFCSTLVSSYAEPAVNRHKYNLKEEVLHDLTTFVASITGLAATAIAAGFNALVLALGTITPVIRADRFVVIASK